jgi:hypothetical protein
VREEHTSAPNADGVELSNQSFDTRFNHVNLDFSN